MFEDIKASVEEVIDEKNTIISENEKIVWKSLIDSSIKDSANNKDYYKREYRSV